MMTDTTVDFDLLAGSLEAPRCEHPNHGASLLHADGNEHYIRFMAPCRHVTQAVKVACRAWLEWVAIHGVQCPRCLVTYPTAEVLADLGPVRGGS